MYFWLLSSHRVTKPGFFGFWFGFFFLSTGWLLILRAPNPLQMARQVLQAQCYWGITSRVRKAIYDMSPLEANVEKLRLEGSKVEVSNYFSGSKIKARSSHGWLLFSSSSSPAVSLFELSPTLSFISLFHIEYIQVLRMSEWQMGTGRWLV